MMDVMHFIFVFVHRDVLKSDSCAVMIPELDLVRLFVIIIVVNISYDALSC